MAPKKSTAKASPVKRNATKAKASIKGDTIDEKILSVLSGYRSMGATMAITKTEVCLQVGYKSLETKSFREAMKRLKDRGHIQYPTGKTVVITDAGQEVSPEPAEVAPLDNSALHETIKERLAAKWPKGPLIFDTLLEEGIPYEKKALCKAVGYSGTDSKGFREPLSFMKKMEWVEDPKKGYVQLSDKVFPFGRDK